MAGGSGEAGSPVMIRGDRPEDLLARLASARQERDLAYAARDEAIELCKHTADPPGSVQWHNSYRRLWGTIDDLNRELALQVEALEAVRESKDYQSARADAANEAANLAAQEADDILAFNDTLKQALREHHDDALDPQADCAVCKELFTEPGDSFRHPEGLGEEPAVTTLDDAKRVVLESIPKALETDTTSWNERATAARDLAETFAVLNREHE